MDELKGIQNIGNTCYMNSAIQLFLNYKVIKKFLLVNDFTDIRLVTLKKFIQTYEPKLIKLLLGQKNKIFIGNKQNDSHECLITILEILEESIKNEDTIRAKIIGYEKKITIGNTNIPITKLLDSILNIYMVSYIKCPMCMYISETKKEERILSVSITNDTNNIYECINNFQNIEILNDDNKWKCEKCHNYVCALKWFEIKNYPKYLTIHIKRFNNDGKKNFKTIKVPLELSLNNIKYELKSYINHIGEYNSGHYINNTKLANKFYLLNDNSISESSNNDLNQGYIYLFSKIK
jgi:ubiquitin C-terminal hydrolase